MVFDTSEAHILPMASIDRMVGTSLPFGSKSSVESKLVLQQLASEFLAFVTSEADAISKVRCCPATLLARDCADTTALMTCTQLRMLHFISHVCRIIYVV